jgi:hypothetical protein
VPDIDAMVDAWHDGAVRRTEPELDEPGFVERTYVAPPRRDERDRVYVAPEVPVTVDPVRARRDAQEAQVRAMLRPAIAPDWATRDRRW